MCIRDRSTLDEITGADLILHVIDASSPEFEGQIEAVCEVLDQIGAQSIPTIATFNKCDLLDAETLAGLKRRYPSARFVSARTGEGIEGLVGAIAQAASAADTKLDVLIPYQRGDLVSLAHERCHKMCIRDRSTTETKPSIGCLKVSSKSSPASVAGAIAGMIKDGASVEIQAVGAGAVNQAVKAVAISRGFLSPVGIEICCIPSFADIVIDGEYRTAIRFACLLYTSRCV